MDAASALKLIDERAAEFDEAKRWKFKWDSEDPDAKKVPRDSAGEAALRAVALDPDAARYPFPAHGSAAFRSMTLLIKRLWDDQYVGFAEELLSEMRSVTRGGREAAEKAMLTKLLEATQVRDRIHELFDAARAADGDDSASAGSLGLTCLPREADVESFLSACMAGVPIEIHEPALRIVISHTSQRGCFKED